MANPGLSIVITTCSEKKQSYLSLMAQNYPQDTRIEYIVVDTGTDKSLLESLGRHDFHILSLDEANRAQRLAHGLAQSRAPLVLFNHPRSLVDIAGIEYLLVHSDQLSWGGFTHQFDRDGWGYRWTSWYSNQIRPRLSKVVYLDHSIFFQRHLLNKPIPPVSIFEDTEISKILASHGRPQILPYVSRTSAIRFEKNGFWKQALMNQGLKVGYHLGWSKQKMNEIYEKNINLNE